MSKIDLDKYYTPIELIKHCIDKTKEVLGDSVTQYIEPSAGDGGWLDMLPKDTLSFDIKPEDPRITKQDFLTLQLDYKSGRCCLGNPPFGRALNLARQFYNKATELGDYIAFILPISQLDNNYYLDRFDLIYSEDLGKDEYSGVKVHCCFNIYKRPNIKSKPKITARTKIKGVRIEKFDRCKAKPNQYPNTFDYAICAWGKGIIGKTLNEAGTYASELHLYLDYLDKNIKDKVVEFIENYDWGKTQVRLPKIQLKQLLLANIPELEIEEDKPKPKITHKTKIKGVIIKDYRRYNYNIKKHKEELNFDYGMGSWGVGCIGKQITKAGTYANELHLYILSPIKDKIIAFLKAYDWDTYKKEVDRYISKNNLKKLLLDNIPELEIEEVIDKPKPKIEPEDRDMFDFAWLK